MLARMVLALSLAFGVAEHSGAAGLAPIGVVVYASDAEVDELGISAGSTVYEGEHLATSAGGDLGIRGGAMMLRLEEQTSAVLKSGVAGQKGTLVELASGAVVFSASAAAAVQVRAEGALFAPNADAATIAHVGVVGPKELRVFARRGDVRLSYRGETAVIAEGDAYRVLLNPRDDANPTSTKNYPTKKLGHGKPFILVALAGGAAAAIGLSMHHHPHPHESPEQP